ncbi:MAG: hypothetical protein E7540_05055 [Ruminococcaceae bacterium]|nr:hypothetical protein [Oscillospiraceae bacterium]
MNKDLLNENLKTNNKKIRNIILIVVCVAIVVSSVSVGIVFLSNGNLFGNNNSSDESTASQSSVTTSSDNAYSRPQIMWGDTPLDQVDSSSDIGNSTVYPSSPSNPVINTGSVTVTATATVATGVCVVTGYCSQNTEKIVVSGDNVSTTEFVPFSGKDKKYFMGQVKFTASSGMTFSAVDKGGNKLAYAAEYVYYSPLQSNLMYTGEYVPVFGKNSRIHFYSALLSYSLSTSNFTDSMKNTAENNIDRIVSVAKNAGAEPIFLIIPTSADIYPETLPSGFSEAKGDRLFDEFKRIAESKGAKVIYPLSTMKAHKNDGVGYQLYQHTDSHWSTYGAYWGTYDLFNYISKKFPKAKPRTLKEMGFYTVEMNGGDALFNLPNGLAFEKDRKSGLVPNSKIRELTTLYSLEMPTSTLKDVYHSNSALYLSEDNASAAIVGNNKGDGLPTAVIMRDSFGKVSYDMMNDRFKTVYWGEFDNYVFPYDTIVNANPDYVIYMYSERNLLKIMLGNSNATMLNLR